MAGPRQRFPGRKTEVSCQAAGHPFITSRKHWRSLTWTKLTLATTAARPRTGWAPRTTSSRSLSKVVNSCCCFGLKVFWGYSLVSTFLNMFSFPNFFVPVYHPQRLLSGSALPGTWSSPRMRPASWLVESTENPNQPSYGSSMESP